MASILAKAAKGNRAAMTRLYEQTKKGTYFIARQLLRDDSKTAEITAKAYCDVLQLNILESIASAEEFVRVVQMTVVNHCKTALTRVNAKALRLPADRRFDICEIPEDLRAQDPQIAVFSLFSVLQRMIFVLHTASELTEDQILQATKLDRRTMQDALSAERQNIEKLLPDKTYEQFVEEFADGAGNMLTLDVDEAVEAIIGEIVAPVEKARKKRTLIGVLITLGICALLAGFSALLIWDMTRPNTPPSSNNDTTTTTNAAQASVGTVTSVTATHYADIDIKDHGTITVALDSTTAPETVFNFMSLAENGFYDGLTFHRIMKGFMMQGGSPNGGNAGGSDKNVTGEFAANGIENPLSHIRGAISMARANDYNSGSSQFFIVHEDSTFLDGQYAAFGYVTEGMDIVDAICTAAQPIDDNGTIPAEQQPIINSITVRSVN